jgi:hypothetical protein
LGSFRAHQANYIVWLAVGGVAQWGEWPVSLDKTRKTKVKISMFFVHSLIDKTLLHLYQKNLGQNIVYLLP